MARTSSSSSLVPLILTELLSCRSVKQQKTCKLHKLASVHYPEDLSNLYKRPVLHVLSNLTVFYGCGTQYQPLKVETLLNYADSEVCQEGFPSLMKVVLDWRVGRWYDTLPVGPALGCVEL